MSWQAVTAERRREAKTDRSVEIVNRAAVRADVSKQTTPNHGAFLVGGWTSVRDMPTFDAGVIRKFKIKICKR